MRTSTFTFLLPPTRMKGLLDKDAQIPSLSLERHVSDLIDVRVPSCASSKAPRRAIDLPARSSVPKSSSSILSGDMLRLEG